MTHGLLKARQQITARIPQFAQDRAPFLGDQSQIAIYVVRIATHDRMLRPLTRTRRPATAASTSHSDLPRLVPGAGDYGGPVLDLSSLDLEDIATALVDQTDDEHRWLINPEAGKDLFWTSGTGIDSQTPVDPDELDLICVDPLPSCIWYQDMADFAGLISDERTGRRLARAITGQGRLPPVQSRTA